jgi:hypothetical protein
MSAGIGTNATQHTDATWTGAKGMEISYMGGVIENLRDRSDGNR